VPIIPHIGILEELFAPKLLKPMFEEPRRFPSLKRSFIKTRLLLDQITKRQTYHWEEQYSVFEQMVVVLEDRRYFRHKGIDWRSVVRVLVLHSVGRGKGGASTIEMQFVRTALAKYERTFWRKSNEMILAWLLNFHMNKANILKSYISIAYFGTGLWGAEVASQRIFGKATGDISLEESAFLASMLVYPMPRNPTDKWKSRVERRAAYGVKLWKSLEKTLKDRPKG
jgi:membrane peptidoglycan carboxypeptidase